MNTNINSLKHNTTIIIMKKRTFFFIDDNNIIKAKLNLNFDFLLFLYIEVSNRHVIVYRISYILYNILIYKTHCTIY